MIEVKIDQGYSKFVGQKVSDVSRCEAGFGPVMEELRRFFPNYQIAGFWKMSFQQNGAGNIRHSITLMRVIKVENNEIVEAVDANIYEGWGVPHGFDTSKLESINQQYTIVIPTDECPVSLFPDITGYETWVKEKLLNNLQLGE